MKRTKFVVTGAGGFIGHHLVSFLKRNDYWVRGVDFKYPEYTPTEADEFEVEGPWPTVHGTAGEGNSLEDLRP